MCVTREQVFYQDRYSYNRFGPSRLGSGLAAMFPGLPTVDVDELGELPAALESALDDITPHRGTAEPIEDVIRIETAPREKATPIIMEMMRSVYPHDQVFGE